MKVDIAILDAASAVGSNLCNYLIQHTKYQLVAYDALAGGTRALQKTAASISSRSRFQFYPIEHSSSAFLTTMDMHTPQFVMGDLTNYSFDQVVNLFYRLAYVTSLNKVIFSIPYHHKDLDKLKAFFSQESKVVLLVTPTIFGTRCFKGEFECDAFLAATSGGNISVSSDLERWMYVKDYYNNMLYSLNLGPGAYNLTVTSVTSRQAVVQMFRDFVAAGSAALLEEPIAEQGITTMTSWELSKLWEHTFVWYLDNPWCR